MTRPDADALDEQTEREIEARSKAEWKGEPECPVRFTCDDLDRIQSEAILADRARMKSKIESLEPQMGKLPETQMLMRCDVLALFEVSHDRR